MSLGAFPIETVTLAEARSEMLLALELENVDNTSDANKPVSVAQAAADDAAQAAAEATAQAALDAAVGTLEDAIDLKADTSATTAALAGKISSSISQAGGTSGSDAGTAITNIVAITESAYNVLAGISPVGPDHTNASTVYLIT